MTSANRLNLAAVEQKQQRKLVFTGFKLDPADLDRVDALAKADGSNRSVVIREAVNDLLARRSA